MNKELFLAADISEHPLRYLDFSGTRLIRDKNYAWSGTRQQFEKLVTLHEWDGLSLVPKMKK